MLLTFEMALCKLEMVISKTLNLVIFNFSNSAIDEPRIL